MNKISPIIEESHRTIEEACKHFGLKVPPSNIVVTVQSKGRKQAIGWFWQSRWKADGKALVHEINLSAEHLKDHHMGETLLHELAHAENQHNGIKDTDKTGRRHNKKFKTQAEALGLSVTKSKLGFAHTDLGQPATDFLNTIKFDKNLFALVRLPPPKGKIGSRLIKCECPDCGYVVRVTQKWIEQGLPLCGVCENVELQPAGD